MKNENKAKVKIQSVINLKTLLSGLITFCTKFTRETGRLFELSVFTNEDIQTKLNMKIL